MPVIKLINHTETEPIAELMRLFFGESRLVGPDLIIAGEDSPVIYSELKGSLSGSNQLTVSTYSSGLCSLRENVDIVKYRRELKRQMYFALERFTGISFPWGSLTGVRPTQIALEMYQQSGHDQQMALAKLIDYWRLSEEKAVLGLETALAESELISTLPANAVFVYVGIPFCPSRCSYCSFISRDARRQKQHLSFYVDAVIEEAKIVFSQLDTQVDGIYIGGGTPTSLSDHDFDRLLNGLKNYVPLIRGSEYTVEAGRPDTITARKLEIIKAAGATRICINPQTMHDQTLINIGRNHTSEQTLQAFELARRAGLDHINMDLIAGLPGENASDLLDSVASLLRLDPESITLHTLAIKRSARLQQEAAITNLQRLPDQSLATAVAKAGKLLRSADYSPYYLYRQKEVAGGLENTGFCKPGHACIYNVAMMSDRFDIIGLGSGSISKKVSGRNVRRTPNSKDLLNYQNRLQELAQRKINLFKTEE